MKNRTASTERQGFLFFALTFIISIPIYVLYGMASNGIILPQEMAFLFVSLGTFSPITSALILTVRQNGWHGAKKLLWRAFDQKRVANKSWYLPTLFLPPVLVWIALGIAVLAGLSTTADQFPIMALPIVFAIYFIMGIGEEVGWMGYAFEPMQEQWGAAKAALLLGIVWALWHVPIWFFLIGDPALIVAQALSLVAIRLLLVWLFDNTGNSVFIAILFHAIYNVAISLIPVNLIVLCLVLFVAAIIVIFLWGPTTLADFRWRRSEKSS
jgi:membrane protease YdiL (CAAX protease family)